MNQHNETSTLKKFGYKQELDRSLNVWLLTAFGVNYMIPLAPAIIFGVIASTSGTTVALPYLLAFFAMFFTASSYAFMVKKFPIAGSLYSYVARSTSQYLGFIAGWVLLLDYVLVPTVTAVSAVLYFQNYFPNIPFSILLCGYILITGLLNIIGVNILARLGLVLLIVSEVILVLSFVFWGHHAVAVSPTHSIGALFSLTPFHFDHVPALLTATSIAVLSYLGFDAITTLAEESVAPKRDIPRAIFMSLCIGALTMFLCGYLGILASPHILQDIKSVQWQNTALFFVSKQSGGSLLAEVFTAGFILSMFVFNIVSTTAASRLLYGMGRDHVLPNKIFARINKRFKTPHYNILLIMAVEIIIGLKFSLATISELVNFGALVGFSLLNLAVIYYSVKHWQQIESRFKTIQLCVFPALGMVILLCILVSMNINSLIVGSTWLVLGVLYGKVLLRQEKRPTLLAFQ